MQNTEIKYVKIYRCPKCNMVLAGKNTAGEFENLPAGKMKVGDQVITITCSKCNGVKILYLKNKN